MNVDDKKTVLDDEASIYQNRKQVYTKEDIKKLSSKDKLIYFKDYYLLKTLIVLLIIVVLGVIVKEVVFNTSKCVLNVACLNECTLDDTKTLTNNLQEYVVTEDEDDYIDIASYNLEMYQMNMSYGAKLSGGGIDVIICTYDYFVEAAQAGVFADLSELLPADAYEKVSDKILNESIVETDDEGAVISTEEPAPYGIDISDSTRYGEFNDTDEQVVLCVVNGVTNKENAIKALTYFAEE